MTSDVREYIVHVGAEADLSATMTVTPQTPSPTNEVTITITASNAAGKDEAQETKVDVTLPEGLTYSSLTDDATATEQVPQLRTMSLRLLKRPIVLALASGLSVNWHPAPRRR